MRQYVMFLCITREIYRFLNLYELLRNEALGFTTPFTTLNELFGSGGENSILIGWVFYRFREWYMKSWPVFDHYTWSVFYAYDLPGTLKITANLNRDVILALAKPWNHLSLRLSPSMLLDLVWLVTIPLGISSKIRRWLGRLSRPGNLTTRLYV